MGSGAERVGEHGSDYTWRAFGREDLAAWSVLLAETEAVDQEDEHHSRDDLLEKFDDPYRDFPGGSIAAFDVSSSDLPRPDRSGATRFLQ